MYESKMTSKTKQFTTSGLNRLVQKATSKTYPRIHQLAGMHLDSNPAYSILTSTHKSCIKSKVQAKFFAWMVSNRQCGKTTTSEAKAMMYKSIVEKHLATIEDGQGLFDFLGSCQAPAFNHCDPFAYHDIHPDGVIPFSLPLSALPTQPKNTAVLNTMTSESDDSGYSSDSDDSLGMNDRECFEMFGDLDVAHTLREISDLNDKISLIVNNSTLDSLLKPIDWFSANSDSERSEH